MEIKILDGNFKLRGIIDSFTSLRYTECLREAGHLDMRIPFDSELYGLLKPPARLLIENLIFNAEVVRCEGEEILVSGVGIFDEFRHIYVCDPSFQSSTPTRFLSNLASKASFEGVKYVIYGQTEVVEQTVDLYSWCDSYASIMLKIFHDYSLGYRMLYDSQKQELGFYVTPLNDKAYDNDRLVIVSDEREDYELISASLDVKNYKNNIDLLQWYGSTGISYNQSFDRSHGEPKRSLASLTSIPAFSEADIYSGFRSIASELFIKHSKKQEYRIRLSRELLVELGDIVFFECSRLKESLGAVIVEKETSYSDTGLKKILTLEVDK